MQSRSLLLLVPLAIGACSSVLDVTPTSAIPAETAISDPIGARTALVGAYNSLQSLSYYGESYVNFLEVVSDNARATGTSTAFADGDANALRADNSEVAAIWVAAYTAINRANVLIKQVPTVTQLSTAEQNEIVGEAYFLRALHYHNLVRLYGGVPLRLEPAASLSDAASATRASVTEVYTQILADLAKAKTMITNTSATRTASLGAVYALEARVQLYQRNWAAAEAAAAQVEARSYALAPAFSDLFNPTGADTPEDIFRVIFTPAQDNFVGYYYLRSSKGGRYEAAPTPSAMTAFDPASGGAIARYAPADARGQWSIQRDGTRAYVARWRTAIGDEDIHVIRFAEVILIRAEALAQLNRLPEAVVEYNRVKTRAGQAADLTVGRTQADVLAAIALQRRLELAFEGDRWPDLVRTGETITTMGLTAQQSLFPIPQREIDTAPGITQNPGY